MSPLQLCRHWDRSMADSVCHVPLNFQLHYKLKFFQPNLQILSNKLEQVRRGSRITPASVTALYIK